MGSRTASWLAWSMCLLAAAAIAGTLAVDVIASSLDELTILGVPAILAFSFVGALIASRRPDNPIGWILCGAGLSFALGSLAGEYATYALITEPGSLPGRDVMAWLGTWIWPPGIILMFTYLLLLFPDGRLPSRRWKPVAWLAAVALLITVIPVAITAWPIRGPILANIGEDAPAGSSAAFKVAYNLQVSGILLLFVLGIASAVSLVIRLRRATGDERAQLKWFAYAGAFAVVAVIANSPLFHIGGDVLPGIAILMIPAAVGIAMFKYRLYDIDVVINKTVVVAVLATFVTAIYLAIVWGSARRSGRRGSRTFRSPSQRPRSSRSRSSPFASAPGVWPTASSTGSERRPTRSSLSSPSGWLARMRPRTCCPGWPGFSERGREQRAPRCGCASATSFDSPLRGPKGRPRRLRCPPRKRSSLSSPRPIDRSRCVISPSFSVHSP